MSVMIETENLGRYFGEIKAVDGVSFSVGKGEVLGFLGPNGAGKSTTMKMITCFLAPSFGTAKVGGFDVVNQSREVRKLIGYLPENAPLYGEMEVREFLSFICEVRELAAGKTSAAIDRVLSLCSLGDVQFQRIETLSKGFKRRVGLAQALIHDPLILVLDEPTDGLDPNQKHEVRTLINSMAQEKCIILSTHILEEVDAVCNRAIIIAKGKIVADARPEELKRQSKLFGAVTVTFESAPTATFSQELGSISGVSKVTQANGAGTQVSYTLFSKGKEPLLPAVIREAENRKWAFSDLRLESGHLDEVFRRITE